MAKTNWLFLFLLLVIGLGVIVAFYREDQEGKASQKFQVGWEDFSKEEYKRALKTLSEVSKEYPNTKAGKTALYLSGKCYFNLGEYENCIDLLQKCPQLEENTESEKYALLGYCCHNEGANEKALCYYNKAIELASGLTPLYLYNKAAIHQELDQLDQAKECLEKICSEHPYYDRINDVKKRLMHLKHLQSLPSN